MVSKEKVDPQKTRNDRNNAIAARRGQTGTTAPGEKLVIKKVDKSKKSQHH